MSLLRKQIQSYEMEINSLKNLIEINKTYYETKKQENILWAKKYNNKIFKRIYDKNNKLRFRCKICWYEIEEISIYKENLNGDKYIKCPHCRTTRYLDPLKIVDRLNKNLDKEFNVLKMDYLKKIKVLEINLKYLKEKNKNQLSYSF